MSNSDFFIDIDEVSKSYFKDEFFDILLSAIIAEEKIEYDLELSLAIVSDDEIQKLNAAYRDKNKPTDVLSFREEEAEISFPEHSSKKNLGDVVISKDTALKQAEEKQHSFEYEVAFLFVHGVLHLLDYDHERSKEEEKIMFDKTDVIMETIKRFI